MKHICFENSIPLETCNYIKDFFDSHPELHVHKPNNPKVIKINSPWSHLHEVLDPILSKYFHTNKGQGGNIYKHTNYYSPHVDSDQPYQLINVNIFLCHLHLLYFHSVKVQKIYLPIKF